jgi:PAS domain-containing protein
VPVAHRVIVAVMRDGIIVLDVQSRVVEMNPAAEDILGCPRWLRSGSWSNNYCPASPN